MAPERSGKTAPGRERLDEIENGKLVYVICQSGLRSYIACRILEGNGYEAYNFSGGYRYYAAVVSDGELIDRLRRGETAIMDYICDKYKNLVRRKAKSMFILGGDSEDLIQEGMIGLMCGVREYQGTRPASFRTFAEICIRNRLYSAVRAAARDKHSPLNQSVPLEIPFFDSHTVFCTAPLLSQTNPEDLIIGQERFRDRLSDVRKQLSEFEAKILGYYLDGLTILRAFRRAFSLLSTSASCRMGSCRMATSIRADTWSLRSRVWAICSVRSITSPR